MGLVHCALVSMSVCIVVQCEVKKIGKKSCEIGSLTSMERIIDDDLIFVHMGKRKIQKILTEKGSIFLRSRQRGLASGRKHLWSESRALGCCSKEECEG